jgi:hypothetical protein
MLQELAEGLLGIDTIPELMHNIAHYKPIESHGSA